jgi:signal transduction histidine kinase
MPAVVRPAHVGLQPVLSDTGFYVAVLLAVFAMLFGTRHLDAAERHEGMVAAVAFESIVKLAAFIAVGVYVTFVLYDGFGDLFGRAAEVPELARLLAPPAGPAGGYAAWTWLIVLSGLAFLLLPRQFQVAVVENVDESHLRTASWLLPLYLLAINLFVLPIAFGGVLHFKGAAVDADTYVLALPIAEGRAGLAFLVFLGGLSAATGMVIVETVALATMISNDLVLPALLRGRLAQSANVQRLLLVVRRAAIAVVVALGYAYFRFAGEAYALVAIGLISFAAVAQFAPAVLGGMYWRDATRAGAYAGLIAGFAVWLYTLLLPSFARSGWLPRSFLDDGPAGIGWLRPEALAGLQGLDPITHAMLWSLLANVGAYVMVSLRSQPSAVEQGQALRFVDAFAGSAGAVPRWTGEVSVDDLRALLERFVGVGRAAQLLGEHAHRRGIAISGLKADASLVEFVETQLAGAIGSASARVLVASIVKEEAIDLDGVMDILDETSQVLAYSRELEAKKRELEMATGELRAANERLKELDRMKDDFVSTVSHELRTPLTSIRAFAEILHDNPDTKPEKRQQFVGIILRETERLTRLINQMLDLAKIESGRAEWGAESVDLKDVVREAVESTGGLYREKGVALAVDPLPDVPPVIADRDRLMQVMLNLLSNAVKFSSAGTGRVRVALRREADALRVDVSDNGPGIAPADHEKIFEKFRQGGETLTDRPPGTGLGLPISRRIVRQFGGELWVESSPGAGATFSFTVPLRGAEGGGEWASAS